jgi:putative membrane protein (TIGR04086 family)
VIKAVAVALLCSVLLCAIYALVLRVAPMADVAITVVTQVLKGVSLATGTILFLKGEKGLVKGAVCGLLFSMLGYLTFSAFGGDFSLSWLIALEILLFAAVGGLTGVAAVNLKRG